MDSLCCGKARLVATVHWTVAKSRLSSPFWLSRPLRCSVLWGSVSFFRFCRSWWAKMDSNHRPHDYQSCALASWAIGPFWWRLAGSNRWPPACKAGALPAELNPQIFPIFLQGTSIVNCQLSIVNSSVPSKLNNAKYLTLCSDLRTLRENIVSSKSP